MTRLAFCGLGRMGLPMARRLIEDGHQLTVWNRTPERARPLQELGARLAGTPAEAAAEAEGLITMLATPDALERVMFGSHGAVRGMDPGTTLIEMSTVGPEAVQGTATWLPEGIDILDAPVLGTVPQAEQGTLKIFVGGADATYERWRPVLEAMGTPSRIGALGSGAAMKLVVNSTLVALMTALGEALALADGMGLPEETVLDVLSDSPIRVPATSKRGHIQSGRYPPNFTLSLALKDAGLILEEAKHLGLNLPVAHAAEEVFRSAERAGLGDLDYSAVVAHLRRKPASHG